MITIQDFKKVEMKVGKIVAVEEHPGAEKLWVLRVDLAEGALRTLVAGLKPYYTKEELAGKLVVVATNLQPARIRGVESNGMVMAAQEGQNVVVLTLDRPIASGSPVL